MLIPHLGRPSNRKNQHIQKRDAIFQNPDPPEAPAPEKPYLRSPATHKNHQKQKTDITSQNPFPPKASAPEIPLESPDGIDFFQRC